jgi:hypothetical protein
MLRIGFATPLLVFRIVVSSSNGTAKPPDAPVSDRARWAIWPPAHAVCSWRSIIDVSRVESHFVNARL